MGVLTRKPSRYATFRAYATDDAGAGAFVVGLGEPEPDLEDYPYVQALEHLVTTYQPTPPVGAFSGAWTPRSGGGGLTGDERDALSALPASPKAHVYGAGTVGDAFAGVPAATAALPALADADVLRDVETRSERSDWFIDGVPGQGPDVLALSADYAALLQTLADGPAEVVVDRAYAFERSLPIRRSVRVVGRGVLTLDPGGYPQNAAVDVRPRFLDFDGSEGFTDEATLGTVPAVRIDDDLGHAGPGWGTRTLVLPIALPPQIGPGSTLFFRLGRHALDSQEAGWEGTIEVEAAADNGDGTATLELVQALPRQTDTQTLTVAGVTDEGGGRFTLELADPLTMQLKEHDRLGRIPDGNPPIERTVLRFDSGAVAEVAALASPGDGSVLVTVTSGAVAPGDAAVWGRESWVFLVESVPSAELDVVVDMDDENLTSAGAVRSYGAHVGGRVDAVSGPRAATITAGSGALELVRLRRQTAASNARVIDVQSARVSVERLECGHLVGSLSDTEGPYAELRVGRGYARLAGAPVQGRAVVNHNPESTLTHYGGLELEGGGVDGNGVGAWALFASPTAFPPGLRSQSCFVDDLVLRCDVNNVWASHVLRSLTYTSPTTGAAVVLDRVVTRRLRLELSGVQQVRPSIFGAPQSVSIELGADDNGTFDAAAQIVRARRPEAAYLASSDLQGFLTAGERHTYSVLDGAGPRLAYEFPNGSRYAPRLEFFVRPEPGESWPAGAYVELEVRYLTSAALLDAERAHADGWHAYEPGTLRRTRVLTETAYQALVTAGALDASTIYFRTDG